MTGNYGMNLLIKSAIFKRFSFLCEFIVQDLLDKVNYEWCERFINLYKILIWPVLFLWILAALTRIILLFVAI